MNWVLITGAYPPDKGGLADYTAVVATALARQGDQVTVVTGPLDTPAPLAADGVRILPLSDHFGRRGLAELDAFLATQPPTTRLFVQYVPQALGPRRTSRFKGLPLTFAWWLRRRSTQLPVWTMFHEATVTSPPGSGVGRKMLSLVTDRMLGWTAGASERIFVAMRAWQPYIENHLTAAQRVEYLPIPSNVGTAVSGQDREHTRAQLLRAHQCTMVGHFGTFSSEVACLMEQLVRQSAQAHPERQILLVGDGSREFARGLAGTEAVVTATGRLASDDVARHLSACDLMIQPFPDGASTRRGSIMAGLALGVPVVSNLGVASEPIWQQQQALALAPNTESLPSLIDRLLAHPDECRALGERGRQLYEEQFSLAHTVRTLRA